MITIACFAGLVYSKCYAPHPEPSVPEVVVVQHTRVLDHRGTDTSAKQGSPTPRPTITPFTPTPQPTLTPRPTFTPTPTATEDPASLAAQRDAFHRRLSTAVATKDDPTLRVLVHASVWASDYNSAYRAATSISAEPIRTNALHMVAVCAAADEMPRTARQAAQAIAHDAARQAAMDAAKLVEASGDQPLECRSNVAY